MASALVTGGATPSRCVRNGETGRTPSTLLGVGEMPVSGGARFGASGVAP